MRTALPPLTPNAWLRYDAIMAALRGVPDGTPLLEVGPGQGAISARLARRFRYLGVEQDTEAAAVAAARVAPADGEVRVGDALALTAGQRFGVVCAFEVLEHLADDAAAAAAWVDRLAPGGWLVLSVPAGPHRLGPWDAAVGHYRRYDRAGLAAVLAGAGLTDVRLWANGMPLGYLLETVRNAVARRRGVAAGPPEPSPTPGRQDGEVVPADHGFAARTAASGRQLQPDRWGWAIAVGAAPFRLAQRPFRSSGLGTGLVAVGVRRGG